MYTYIYCINAADEHRVIFSLHWFDVLWICSLIMYHCTSISHSRTGLHFLTISITASCRLWRHGGARVVLTVKEVEKLLEKGYYMLKRGTLEKRFTPFANDCGCFVMQRHGFWFNSSPQAMCAGRGHAINNLTSQHVCRLWFAQEPQRLQEYSETWKSKSAMIKTQRKTHQQRPDRWWTDWFRLTPEERWSKLIKVHTFVRIITTYMIWLC